MATFFVGGQFPSFKPIRTTGDKILALIDSAIAGSTGKDKEFLINLKEKATAEPTKMFYFTIAQANLIKIL